jgi:tRNA(His) 5'-end guanylyltransferase
MIATTKFLCEHSNATIGYTQSDEISLAWWATHYDSEIFFGGRIQKMTSSLAALATGFFVANYEEFFGTGLPVKIPTFDCRVWNVPTAGEGANVFLWRELDASKNSISMAARSMFSHSELMNKNGSEMQEMMWQKGINWNDYPSFFKRGTFIQRKTLSRKFTAEELEKLPAKHAARSDPDLVIQRSEYQLVDMPPFNTVTNREAVVFAGANPEIAE